MQFTPTEIATGLAAIAGGLGLVARKMGMIKISNYSEHNKTDLHECPDPACKSTVQHISGTLNELRLDFKAFKDDLNPTVNDLSRSVAALAKELEMMNRGKP